MSDERPDTPTTHPEKYALTLGRRHPLVAILNGTLAFCIFTCVLVFFDPILSFEPFLILLGTVAALTVWLSLRKSVRYVVCPEGLELRAAISITPFVPWDKLTRAYWKGGFLTAFILEREKYPKLILSPHLSNFARFSELLHRKGILDQSISPERLQELRKQQIQNAALQSAVILGPGLLAVYYEFDEIFLYLCRTGRANSIQAILAIGKLFGKPTDALIHASLQEAVSNNATAVVETLKASGRLTATDISSLISVQPASTSSETVVFYWGAALGLLLFMAAVLWAQKRSHKKHP